MLPNGPVYAPLDETKREIRVLQVSRCDATDKQQRRKLKANLLPVSLDDDPAYLALSYTWGDPSPVGSFKTDHIGAGDTFRYNQGVFDIVNTLVPEDSTSTLYLWIDALCINQSDMKERESQVLLMGDVYTKTRSVLIYLGEPNLETSLAIELCYKIEDCVQAYGDAVGAIPEEKFKTISTQLGISLSTWLNLPSLFSRRWFTRYWIIQEASLGPDPVAICGKEAVPWEKLTKTYIWILTNFTYLYFLVSNMHRETKAPADLQQFQDMGRSCLGQIADIRHSRSLGTYWTFQDLLQQFSRGQATDPRDRVFALLGLAPRSFLEDTAFRPSYTIRIEELYTQVTARLLALAQESESEATLLVTAGLGVPRAWEALPSWVPDLTKPPHVRGLCHVAQQARYHAASGTALRFQYNPARPKELVLQGEAVDAIRVLSSPGQPALDEMPMSDLQNRELDWLKHVLELALGPVPLTDEELENGLPGLGEALRESLWQTLVAGSKPLVGRKGPTARGWAYFLRVLRHWPRLDQVHPNDADLGGMSLQDLKDEVRDFADCYASMTQNRRFFVSSRGHFGLTHVGSQVGDAVCVFSGLRTPFVVRPVPSSEGSAYWLVGEAYHDGLRANCLKVGPLLDPIRLV